MKAVAFRQNLPVEHPDSLVDIDLPRPEARGHDLLVRIEAVAVNPVDTKVRRFHAPPADGSWRVPGWDAAGVVEAVGDQVSRFRPGDRVWYAGDLTRQGSHAEYQAVDERLVGRMPESLDFAEAAALPLTAITAWELLFDRLQLRDADGRLLIVGAAGGVGSIMIQLARALSRVTVIGTASRPDTAEWVRELGAHHVIDHRRPPSAGRGAARSRHRIGHPRGQPHAHRPALRADRRGARAAGAARPDRRSGASARRAGAQAQEPVAALGTDVHPLALPDR